METDNILSRQIYQSTRTVQLMDEFEACDKQFTALMLVDVFCIKYNRKLYWVSLRVERKPRTKSVITSNLTFTDFKKYLLERVFTLQQQKEFKILSEIFSGFRELSKKGFNGGKAVYQFPIPVQFNAQNSRNRSGYGNKYYGEELVYEGTLYGDTTDYMFTCAEYQRW